MPRIVADIESDGLLPQLTQIHVICTLDLDTGEKRSFNPGEIDAGIAYLETASELIFHNGITFDIPALRKIYPDFSTDGITLTDTLVLSRLLRPDLKNDDFTQVSGQGSFQSACTALTACVRGVSVSACSRVISATRRPIGLPGRRK